VGNDPVGKRISQLDDGAQLLTSGSAMLDPNSSGRGKQVPKGTNQQKEDADRGIPFGGRF